MQQLLALHSFYGNPLCQLLKNSSYGELYVEPDNLSGAQEALDMGWCV